MEELVEKVREALAAEYSGAPNGRVRDVPDRRAIRWYTTIGLVDRPLGMRGRTALYGPRHLQQLVAIKRRQAEGQSLAQIQADLVWLSPEELADASRVPSHLMDSDEPTADTPVRHRFWADQPAPAPAPPAPPPPTDLPLHVPASLPASSPANLPSAAAPVHGVALGGGAILLLPHPVSDRDRADIAAAAEPLRNLLQSRGLIDGRSS